MFIHLRAYSDYSFGMSNLKIKKIVMQSYDYNMPAICLSDKNMFGALEFATTAAAMGIQPIIGCSICVYDNIDGDKFIDGEVLLIVKNQIGYNNLLKIVTNIYVNSHEKKISWQFVVENSEGLIVILGATSDDQLLNNIIFNYDIDTAKRFLNTIECTSKAEIFIELTRYKNSNSNLQSIENMLLSIAYDMNIPLVATNPINFLDHKHYEACEALFCIINNRYILDESRPRVNTEHYFKSAKEMIDLFDDIPEAVNNTILIARKCHFFPKKQPIKIPKYNQDIDANEMLEKMAITGLNHRISNLQINKQTYFDRLRFELNLIQKMNFADYFLIVSDFIQWSKSQNIAVGPGRGSGAGSIVAWAIQITELDPIEYGLLFERFLNPERISMPDLDIDFCQLRRDEVIQYVRNKYGVDKIAHIITFGKLQPRAVLRDVGRVLQMPYKQVDRICKMIPQNQANPVTLQQAIDMDTQLQQMRSDDDTVDRLLTIGLQLEGCHRNISTHAAGIIISSIPIVEIMPLYKDMESNTIIGQFSMKYVEAAGLIKFDFLGLKTLTVISSVQEIVKYSYGKYIDMYNLAKDDQNTYEMLSKGNVLGVFQLEGSAGIKEAVRQMHPDQLSDIIALTSLYRPGPMENISTYIARKHNLQAVEIIHRDLKDVLNETYGIIIYQEQVIKIAQILAGYTLGEADILRRAMGKKDKIEMQQQRHIFISKAVERGLLEKHAEEIFDLVNKFASYGFNKAHAAAYALVTYHTAYLKCHYFVEFLVASINLEIHLQDKVNAFCDEAKLNGVQVCSPSINYSMVFFSIEIINDNDQIIGVIIHDTTNMRVMSNIGVNLIETNKKRIRYGLAGIKGAGIKALNEIIQEREKRGIFKNLNDFLTRTAGKGFNKRLFEQLVKSGALSELYDNGNELLLNINIINNYVANITKNTHHTFKQYSLFDTLSTLNDIELCSHKAWSKLEKLQMEHQALGFYLTEHPISLYKDILKHINIMSSLDINKYDINQSKEITIAGVIKECKIRSSKNATNNSKYAFLTINDSCGSIDVSIFDNIILTKKMDLLNVGQLVLCTAIIKNDTQGRRIFLKSIKNLANALQEIIPCFKIVLSSLDAAQLVYAKFLKEQTKNNKNIEIKIFAKCDDESEVEFESKKLLRVTYDFICDLLNINGITISQF